jgi:hypothetical protein
MTTTIRATPAGSPRPVPAHASRPLSRGQKAAQIGEHRWTPSHPLMAM